MMVRLIPLIVGKISWRISRFEREIFPMSDIKITGIKDIKRLMAKKDTWVPPPVLDQYLAAVRKVISAARYKDLYKTADPSELQAIIKIKARRCLYQDSIDIEELVDIGCYSGLLLMRMCGDNLLKRRNKNAKSSGSD